MIDQLKKFVYQVEINTIASSMGFFSDGIKKFYSHFSKKYPEYFQNYLDSEDKHVLTDKENTIDQIANAMVEAMKLFSPENYKSTILLNVVQENERNEFDQRAIETYLWDR